MGIQRQRAGDVTRTSILKPQLLYRVLTALRFCFFLNYVMNTCASIDGAKSYLPMKRPSRPSAADLPIYHLAHGGPRRLALPIPPGGLPKFSCARLRALVPARIFCRTARARENCAGARENFAAGSPGSPAGNKVLRVPPCYMHHRRPRRPRQNSKPTRPSLHT